MVFEASYLDRMIDALNENDDLYSALVDVSWSVDVAMAHDSLNVRHPPDWMVAVKELLCWAGAAERSGATSYHQNAYPENVCATLAFISNTVPAPSGLAETYAFGLAQDASSGDDAVFGDSSGGIEAGQSLDNAVFNWMTANEDAVLHWLKAVVIANRSAFYALHGVDTAE